MSGEAQDRSNVAGGTREARLSHDGDGEPIGAAVFLTPGELSALGVDPSGTSVVFSVENGRLCVRGGDVTGDAPTDDDHEQTGSSGGGRAT